MDYTFINFYQEIRYWQHLMTKMETCPTYLVEIVQQQPTALGLTDALGKGAGGVWI